MNEQDELIERLAREAGFDVYRSLLGLDVRGPGDEPSASITGQVRRLVALVAEHCADIAEEDASYCGEEGEEGISIGSQAAADRIRAKFQEPV